MHSFARSLAKEPLRIVGILWPLALLVPFVPGLPRPSNGGLTWRQEATVALLLSSTLALLWRRARKSRAQTLATARDFDQSHSPRTYARRLDVALAAPLIAFVLWSAASTFRATNVLAAAHYALSWTAYLLFFLTLRSAALNTRLLRATLTLLASVVVVISAADIVGYYGSPNSLISQNGLGEPVAVSIPLFAALALSLRRTRAARLCGAAATLGWLSMLEIAERAPLFGVILGLILLASFAVASPRFRPRSLPRTLALAAAFAACLALQTVPSPFARSRHQTVIARVKETSAQELNTRARLLYWGAAFEMWRAHPLAGVGAGGYDSAFPSARAAFAAAHPDSPLVAINEHYLSTGAHDEYLQILGELGATGLALFLAFCAALVWGAWRALRRSRSPLVPGAVASLAAFAVSSAASSISFRWFGSGLIFFFAAALVTRFACAVRQDEAEEVEAQTTATVNPHGAPLISPTRARRLLALGTAAGVAVFCAICVQATSVMLLASAQADTRSAAHADELYRAALALDPLDAATQFNYGVWLIAQKRERESLPHLRYAVARGFHTSTCYEYLAGAESNAGEQDSSERTLAEGVRVYPRSVFMRVRHAAALARLGRSGDADVEMSAAILLDSRAARGWQQLIENDIDAAIVAAKLDPATVPMPGELQPEDAVFAVLQENERRFPGAVSTGWRAQMRSIELQ
jgi:O-antigen ligase/predicted nucleic acid-binding protein